MIVVVWFANGEAVRFDNINIISGPSEVSRYSKDLMFYSDKNKWYFNTNIIAGYSVNESASVKGKSINKEE